MSGGVELHRDGRLSFRDGVLYPEGSEKAFLAYPLDSKGNISGALTPLKVTLDPLTKLYDGEFTDLQFDPRGVLWGSTSVCLSMRLPRR